MSKDIVTLGLYICKGTKPFPLNSKHRVVWANKAENLVTLIRTNSRNTTLKKPKTYLYSKAQEWIDDNKLVLVEKETFAPQLKLSDEQLAKRYPPTTRKQDATAPSQKKISAPLKYRQSWLPLIDEIKPSLSDVWRGKHSLSSVLEPACLKFNLPLNESYQVLYRFLVNRCSRQSVIPLRFLCGNRGKKRAGKGVSLGRRTDEVRKVNGKNTNFKLTIEWLQKISDTYQETISRAVKPKDAYSTFLNLYCIKSTEIIDGEMVVSYLDSRPSKAQFLNHGPNDDPEQAAWRKRLPDLAYEKNYRPLDGHTVPVTLRTGLTAHVDASSNDRYLVSVFDRAQTIGPARAIPVIDQDTGYIWGFYCGFRVNQEAAKLAILNAATDKIALCAHYGIKIQAGEWHSHLAQEFLADRGEFNCEPVREGLGNLNCSIEYVVTGRADLRGRGERTNGLLHDHNANGSTFGKFRTRGERDPALDADQNIYDFTRELIRLILYHNNIAPVPHLRTTEMRQAGVRPTRKDILEYCINMGYHHKLNYDEDDLILALAPEFEAVVTRDGVYPIVRRDIESGDEVILAELRYLGPFIAAERWLEQVRRTGRRFRIMVRMNPNDPSMVWYQDPDTGLHRFDLATKDALLQRLATVHDLTLRKTEDSITLKAIATEAEEERARIQLKNQAERAVIAEAKQKAVENSKGKKGNSSNATGRRSALQHEVAALGQSPVVIPVIPEAPTPATVTGNTPELIPFTDNIIPLRPSPSPDEDAAAFEKWLNGEAI